jgi:23S rRNA (guanosine2251-2'-O)-methyltransferase
LRALPARAMHEGIQTRRISRTGERKPVTRNRPKGHQGRQGDAKRGAEPRDQTEAQGSRAGRAGERSGDRSRDRDRRREGAAGYRPARDAQLIWGFHSVREALRAGRRKLLRLHATSAAAEKLSGDIAAANVPVNVLGTDDIDALLPDGAVHQGVLLEAGPLPESDLGDLPGDGLVLVLDQVTDPHNVGAIVRTAAAFGVNAIVTTERHSPALGGVLAKAASGGLEHVDIITVVNLARALDSLGDMGYLRVGLDSDGPQSLAETTLSRPLALVLGAEGKGLRRLSREKCDELARIDLPGAVRSLNVSNACAVALTIASMRLAAT